MPRQSRSSQPTVRERLGAIPGLSPAIRASSLSTYDEARPGYVERNYLAGNDMARLARSLAAFDQSLIPVMEKYQDRKIERDIARGAELYAQNEALDKNRTNWKDYAEAHPEDSGLNPHLQKGYEQARLKALGIDQKKAMEDAFVQSGMVNERDQDKVNQWMQEFTQNFRKENHLDTYEDRLALAESFSPEEFKNQAALLNKHSLYLQKQNEALAVQKYSDLAVKELEAAFDPAHGGRLFGDPATSHQDVQTVTDIVGKNIQNALNNGVMNANAGEMIYKTVLTYYEKSGRKLDILKSLDYLKTPEGVTVSSLPGVAEKMHNLKQARIEEARSAERHWWAKDEHARKMEKEKWEGEGLMDFVSQGLPPTEKEMTNAGVPKRLQPLFATDVNKWYQAQYTGRKEALTFQSSLTWLNIQADLGELDKDYIINEVAPALGTEEAKKLYDRNTSAKKEDEKVFTSFTKELMSEAYRLNARDKKDVMDQINTVTFGFSAGLSKEQQLGIEASQLAHAKAQLVKSEYVEKYKKSPTDAYLTAVKPKILDEVNTEMRARYGKESASGNGLSIPGQNTPTSQDQPKPQLSSAHSSPNTAAPRTADPLNTVVSEWISSNGLDASGETVNMKKAGKVEWIAKHHPDKAPELYELIRAHTNQARR